jgi:hypothetical protein
MENEREPNDNIRNLRTLLKSAGYTSCRMGTDRRAMFFSGRTREWNIVARANADWLNIYTIVCTVPDEPGMRARLLEAAMRINQKMLLTKFVVGETSLVLELDYRIEHVDIEAIRGLIGLVHANAEEHYAKLFRIVSGDDVLEALDDQTLRLAS